MKKKKIWGVLAAVSSAAVMAGCPFGMKSHAHIASAESEYLVSNTGQCRRLLMELVSAAETGSRYVYTVTGKDYEPESLVIAQMFPDTVNISNVRMREYWKDGHRYVTCRIGFERKPSEPERNQDEIIPGDEQDRRWLVGDVRTLKLGEQTYRFRYVDDDYKNNSESQTCALFLCETVIRSDVDSTESTKQIQIFGADNNYKESSLRSWLTEQAEQTDVPFMTINTGVNAAFIGASVPGSLEQFADSSFLYHALPVQVLKEQLFLLSLEEAFRYREELWEIENGLSPYSRGYWLRTPLFLTDADGNFCYGNWQYVIDLENGCIRPAEVSDGSIGIRPAFCLPQV